MEDEKNINNQDSVNKNDLQKSSDYLYLEKLKFNPELRKNWLNFFVSNFRVVILLIILLTTLGVYSFTKLPRESNPEVKIPIAVVITTYPGASPADIEELVTKKLETGISGLKNIKKITSNSSNSVSSITVEYEAKADIDDSIRKLREEVNDTKKDLPTDANDPIVKEVSLDDTPIWTTSISGPYDGYTLRKFGEDAKDELEKIPGVREVVISGGDEKEFEIAYDPQKLTFYNLTPDQANSIVKGTNITIPSGNFEGDKFNYPIRVDGKFYTAEKIANTPLFHTDEGAIVYLKDVANVTEKTIKKTIYSRLSANGQAPQNDITLQIIKKTGSSIIDTVNSAKQTLNKMTTAFPGGGIRYDVTIDQSEIIQEDFNQLTHDFILTIILVFGILFLIVGIKEALVAGLAVPLVFFATFGVMNSTGISLNFLSMFSLILALGLLVDDAIVVVSATKQYMKSGKFTPEEAVLLVLNDFKVVLTTTTLTTVWAFLPLLSTTGIIGEFIKSIPITVSTTLISSLIIALIVNHPLAAVLERIRLTRKMFFFLLALIAMIGVSGVLLGNIIIKIICIVATIFSIFYLLKWYFKKGRSVVQENKILIEKEWQDDELIKKKLKEQGAHDNENFGQRLMHGIIHFDKLLPIYEKYLNKILKDKKTRAKTLIITFSIFIVAILLPITGILPSEFFPVTNNDYIYINIEGPNGLRLDETNKIVTQVEEKLLKYPDIDNFATIVGRSSSGSSLTSGSSSSHLASVTIKLKDKEKRKIKSYELSEKILEDLKPINQATITIETPRGGPPSGSAFEARISGEDLQTLNKIANELKPTLSSIKGVANPEISLKESPADYTFSLDSNKMELYNLNAAYVGSALRMAISGSEITTVIRSGKETKVVARFDESKLPNLETIQNIQLLNNLKQPVFIKDVAKIELKPSVNAITRIDQKRVVLLSADVDSKTRPAAVLSEFQKNVKKYKMPTGYEIIYGGENEQNQESVMSIIRAMAVAGILIISTLVIQFNSFKKAFIVLATIPLALIGVFFGMTALRITLSFPGLIGILALCGIVVKNAIILIDKINLNIKSGIEFKASIVDAGKSRLEAIFITSICTIFGLIPITISNETWTALGGAIICGLMISSFMTLFIVPTLFMTVIKDGERF